MRADIRRLVDWVAAYTLAPPGEVLAMALRVNAFGPAAPPTGWRVGRAAAGGAADGTAAAGA